MKTRQTFVSNSSSSSFIICKKMITEEQCDKIIKWFDANGKDMYDDCGISLSNEKNYIMFNCNSHHGELVTYLKSIGVKPDDYTGDYR